MGDGFPQHHEQPGEPMEKSTGPGRECVSKTFEASQPVRFLPRAHVFRLRVNSVSSVVPIEMV